MRTALFSLLSVLSFLLAPLSFAQERAADYPPAYLTLMREAMRSFSQRDFETALAFVNKADELLPPTPPSMNVRGAIAIEQKRFDEGRKLCLAALQKDPRYFPARFNLAEIPFVQKNYAEARNIFQRLQQDHPEDELLKFRIYLTYLLENNESAAKQALEELPFLSDTPAYYYARAAWEFAHANPKGGQEWVDRGNWVFPPIKTQNFADVFYDLGWLKRPGTEDASEPTAAPTLPAEAPAAVE